jgi:signal transduction histidine kinase
LKTNGDGSVGAILEINRDITATLQTEEALRRAERLAAMGRVAGIIAHEINNPLEAIINAFYLLRDHPSLDDEARRFAQLGEEELLRVAHIVRQTLGFYRESQHPTAISIPEILDSVLELQSRHFQVSGIQVEKLYQTEARLFGFPMELKQVFLNLIANAVQAMPTGGRLRLRVRDYVDVRTETSGICVYVGDTGSGIDAQHAKQLFEPFFSTKAAKGTGLGLWISKGIVQKYEGTIHFRSVRMASASATCFRVFLPGQVSAKALKARAVANDIAAQATGDSRAS